MKDQRDKYGVLSLLLFLLVVFTIIVFKTENSFGGGDHFSHFKLAHWGWVYPDMLFSHWGKPAFTILISPFAQLGVDGARMYNILMGLATAWLAWLLAKHFRFKHSWVVILLVAFTPVYFILMFTALTEVTFSFVLVLAIYLFFKEKYIWSAVVISILPLVRTEGIVIIPLFILAFSLRKKYLALPFLSLGFFIISFLGSNYYSSFWWLITEMPYTGTASDIYGSGSLFHFINHNPQILGAALGLLFIVGLILLLYKWVKKDQFKKTDRFYFLLLITGSFIVYYSAHSYVWWKGNGSSLGLIRVMGAVTPLAALTAMVGIDLLLDYRKRRWKNYIPIVLVIVLAWFVYDGIYKHRYGFRLSRPQMMHGEVAEYVKANNLDRFKIYYYNGYLAYKLNLDPRDKNTNQQQLPRNETFLSSVPDSSIIVWDAHFGPNEGRMPLKKLRVKDELRELKVFKPVKGFTVLGGHDYQIIVFQKDLSLKPKLRKVYLDFESSHNSTQENIFKGNKSFKLESKKNYKTLLDVIYQEITDTLSPLKITVDLAFNHPMPIEPNQLLLVCSLESGSDVGYYKTRDLFNTGDKKEEWLEASNSFKLPTPKTVNDRIKIYVWNKGNYLVFLDEVMIKLVPEGSQIK